MKNTSRFIKTIAVTVMVAVVFGGVVIAQDGGGPLHFPRTEGFVGIAKALISLLQGIWMIPAILAGKLMTNEFVFGQFFGLEQYLFAFWQLSKTISLYIIGFLFLWFVFVSFFRQEPASLIKNYLPKLFLATILVHVSWFGMRALVDLSTIGVIAAGQITNSIIGTTEDVAIKKVHVDFAHDGATDRASQSSFEVQTNEISLSDLINSVNDMSGPLLYFGKAILRFDQLNTSSPETSTEGLSTALLIKLILGLMFVIPLILLVVLNFVRIFWIWMYVCLGPLIVLDLVFDGPVAKGDFSQFKLSNIMGLVMQPVAVVGVLSVATIFAAAMNNIMTSIGERQATIADNMLGVGSDANGLSHFNLDTFGDVHVQLKIIPDAANIIGGVFGYLAMSAVTIFLVWSLIKIGFATSEVTKKLTDTTFDFVENMASALPIIPGINASPKALQQGTRNVLNKLTQQRLTEQQNEVRRGFDRMFNREVATFNKYTYMDDVVKRNPGVAAINNGFGQLRRDLSSSKGAVNLSSNPSFRDAVAHLLGAVSNNIDEFAAMALALGVRTDKEKSELKGILGSGSRLQAFLNSPNSSELSNATSVRDNLLLYIGLMLDESESGNISLIDRARIDSYRSKIGKNPVSALYQQSNYARIAKGDYDIGTSSS